MRKVNLKVNFEDSKGDSITSVISRNSSQNNEDVYTVFLDLMGNCTVIHNTEISTVNNNIFTNPSFDTDLSNWTHEGEWVISKNGFNGNCAFHPRTDNNVSLSQSVNLTNVSLVSFYARCDENISIRLYVDSDLIETYYFPNNNWDIVELDVSSFNGLHEIKLVSSPVSNDLYIDKFSSTFVNDTPNYVKNTFQTYYNIIPLTLPYGEYTINTISDNNKYTNNLIIKTIEDIGDDDEAVDIDINLNLCGEVLLEKTCKYFYHDPYMTPNNYDLYFDYMKIPVNNIIEPPHELQKRLQRHLPLTKILHLNLENKNQPQYNNVIINSNLSINYAQLKENLDVNLIVSVVWNDEIFTKILSQEEDEKICDWIDELNTTLTSFNLTNLYTLSEDEVLETCTDIKLVLNDTSLDTESMLYRIKYFLEVLLSLKLKDVPSSVYQGITINDETMDYSKFKDYITKELIFDKTDDDEIVSEIIFDLINHHDIEKYKSQYVISANIIKDYTITTLSEDDEPSDVLSKVILKDSNLFTVSTDSLFPMFEETYTGEVDITQPISYKCDFEKKIVYVCDSCGKVYFEKSLNIVVLLKNLLLQKLKLKNLPRILTLMMMKIQTQTLPLVVQMHNQSLQIHNQQKKKWTLTQNKNYMM